MAIDLSKTRRVVFFEIDRRDPHDLARFHRNISQLTAEGTLFEHDFEEVIGCYQGKMNVAYAMSHAGFNRAFARIEYYFRGQTELYDFDLDGIALVSHFYHGKFGWTRKKLDWAGSFVSKQVVPNGGPIDLDGWTYFPSSGSYFAILPRAFKEEDL